MGDLVEKAYSSCHEAIGAEGVRMSQLIMADAEAAQRQEGGATSWDSILQVWPPCLFCPVLLIKPAGSMAQPPSRTLAL